MKILIVTLGTRGDVQPYVALGRALMESGNDVTICTCVHFEPFVREYGLGYAYVNNDFIDFMHTTEGKIILGDAERLPQVCWQENRILSVRFSETNLSGGST